MNPETNPSTPSGPFVPGIRRRDYLSDDDLYFYARGFFDLVDPELVERELARDPVARHRLRQFEDNIRAHREERILKEIAARQAIREAAAAPAQAQATLADWIAAKAVQLTLRIRRLSDSVDCSGVAGGWRLLPGGAPAVLGVKAAMAKQDPVPPRKWFQIRDRSFNQITVTHSPGGCRIEVLLAAVPTGAATLKLEQPFQPETQQAGPVRRAVVKGNSAAFEDCPQGLHHLTGVEGLDLWILVEPDNTGDPAS